MKNIQKNLIAEGNRLVHAKQYEDGIRHYAKILANSPELFKYITGNITIAKKKFRQLRSKFEKQYVGVCGYDLAHNAAGRAYTLALIYETFTQVDIIGCIFKIRGDKIWEPIRGTHIKKKYFLVDDESNFINESVNFVANNPYDIVHISKPRIPNIILGILYKMIWDAKVIVDVDDEELAFVNATTPISISEYLNTYGKLPPLRDLIGNHWTRIAVGLTGYFDGVTVSNKALQNRYGGQIIRHARNGNLYKASENLKYKNREKYGIPQDKQVVIFLGTPRRHKGIIKIAEALAELDRKDIIFCIVGTFTDLKLKESFLRVAGKNCILFPNQPFNSLPEILSIADCGILLQEKTSQVSQFQTPAKLSDLLAMQLPVLVTDVEGIREFINAEMVVAIQDDEEINKSLENFLNNLEKFSVLKTNIVKHFPDLLSLESNAKRIQEIVQGNSAINPQAKVDQLINLIFSISLPIVSEANKKCFQSMDNNFPYFEKSTHTYDVKENYCNFLNRIENTDNFENDVWDTRDCFSTINTSKELPLPEVVYIVPAVMALRNTTRYRVHHLAEQIKKFARVQIINYKSLPEDFFEKITKLNCIIIIQRLPFLGKLEEDFLTKCKLTPVTIAYDIDDQIFDAYELETWRSSSFQASPESYSRAMQYADQFIVSTKSLRRKIESKFNRPVHIIHNQISQQILNISNEAIRRGRTNDIFTIGYASGSATHDRDFAVAMQGLSSFLELHPNTKFHCIGDVILPNKFHKKFSKQIVVHKKVDWTELPYVLASFDVQLVPLESTPFNKYKSHLKFLESSAVSVPIIASNTGEQALTIIDGYSGILTSNTDECWFNAISWSFNNRNLLKKIGLNAKKYVESFWTTESNFNLARIKYILEDIFFGMLRDKLSIIVVIYNTIDDVRALLDSILRNIKVPYELLIWINSNENDIKEYISGDLFKTSYVIDTGSNVGKAIAANHLFRIASERFIAGIDDDYIVPKSWDERMLYAAKTIKRLGWLSTNLTKESSGIRDLNKTASFPGGSSIFVPSGVGGWVVFTTASARENIGFYKEHGLYGGIDGDYNRRARKLGLTTGYVRNVVGEHKIRREVNLAWELFKQRIQDQMRIFGKDSDKVTDKHVDFFKERTKKLTCSIIVPNFEDDSILSNKIANYAERLMSFFSDHFDYHVKILDSNAKDKFDVSIFLSTSHKLTIDINSLNILIIYHDEECLSYQKLVNYDYIFSFSKLLARKVHELIPEIKVEVIPFDLNPKIFYDVVNKIHNSIKYMIRDYVEYKSTLLFNLRNKINSR